MGRLTGKVAVVTGAASQAEGVGNGAATAILFAREGAKVVLVNRRADRAEALAARIRSEGGEALAFAADVTEPEAVEAMAAFAVAQFRPPRHPAQQCRDRRTPQHAGDDRPRRLAPRLRDQPDLGAAVLPILHPADAGGRRRGDHQRLLAGRRDRSFGLTGRGGLHDDEGGAARLHALGRGRLCRREHPSQLPAGRHRQHADGQQAWRRSPGTAPESVPLQTEGTGWDVGHAAVYLASDEARWVTGVMLPIDGGFLAIRQWPR